MVAVIRRFYVHNFRCLENFDLPIADKPSCLLIGKNGAGKTTVARALEVLQKIARGTNRIKDVVGPNDITAGRTDIPMRFEIEAQLHGKIYSYTLAMELPDGFREMRIFEEILKVDGVTVYERELAQVVLYKYRDRVGKELNDAHFSIDWHMVALPLVQLPPSDGRISIFIEWLSRMLILRPMPGLISGNSDGETEKPRSDVTDFGAWFYGLLGSVPSAYSKFDMCMKRFMPDAGSVRNVPAGTNAKSLIIQFETQQGTRDIQFSELSDGEKCFMICAIVVAASDAYTPLFCFWDEPDNYLALSEVGDFVMMLRSAFADKGQLVVTSHNPEAIQRFSYENTLLLSRKSHLEPVVVRSL